MYGSNFGNITAHPDTFGFSDVSPPPRPPNYFVGSCETVEIKVRHVFRKHTVKSREGENVRLYLQNIKTVIRSDKQVI